MEEALHLQKPDCKNEWIVHKDTLWNEIPALAGRRFPPPLLSWKEGLSFISKDDKR